MTDYVGNLLQVRGAEHYTLHGGKGEGMNFLCVRNGLGLEAFISLDRCGDLSRVTFKGDNMGYFSPCGYVAPQFYDKTGAEFLKSFTAGFFTTCGLTAVGSPCVDEGEVLPLHGTISNTPATLLATLQNENELTVILEVRDCAIFNRKLVLNRKYTFSYTENKISVEDNIVNEGDSESPLLVMYHCNMGYPLLSENAKVYIPNKGVTPRNDHAKGEMPNALKMEVPQACYEESCFYYDVIEKDGLARAGIYNDDIQKGVVIAYDKSTLDKFTQWKMMGKKDYVLGLEPGNCTPDGRDVLRKNGELKFIKPNETITNKLSFIFANSKESFGKEI